MTYLYILGALSFALGALSGFFNASARPAFRVVAKLTASLLFFLTGLLAFIYSGVFSDYAVLVILALALGMLGDVFLCLNPLADHKYKLLFDAMGLGTFLAGHIVFIAIFLSLTTFNYYLLPILVILPAAMVILSATGIMKMGKLAPAYIGYAFILGLMMVSTVNYYINMPSVKSLLALTAGILFAVSDCAISVRKFVKSGKTVHTILIFLVLSTYYTAQVLFALTIAVA